MAKQKRNVPEFPDPEFPWERQSGESDQAFEAFTKYLLMGPERTQNKVCHDLSKSRQLIGAWSSKWKWTERCAAWDNEQARQLREEQTKEIAEMRKRHAKTASLAFALVDKEIKRYFRVGKDKNGNEVLYLNEEKADDLKPSDLARLMEAAVKIERLSRGDTSEVVEDRNGGNAIPAVQIYIPDNGRQDAEDDEIGGDDE